LSSEPQPPTASARPAANSARSVSVFFAITGSYRIRRTSDS
jgi:hypothetical protein